MHSSPRSLRQPIADRGRARRRAHGVRWLAFLLVLAAMSGVVAPPVEASPPTPSFGPSIDGYAGLDSQDTCNSTEQPGVVDFRALLLAAYPETQDRNGIHNILRGCAVGGTSEHKEGRAWDWGARVTDGAETAAVEDALDWLLHTDAWGNPDALARRFGLMYIIWDRQIWKAYPSNGLAAGSWHAYTGDNPHTDHVHFSFGWPGALQQTTWWNAGGTNPPPSGEADGSAMVVDVAGDVWFAAVKADGTLYTRRYDVSAGTWNTFTSHGEGWSANAAPALTAQTNGLMHLFAVKANGHLYSQRWLPGAGWTSAMKQGQGGWAANAGPSAVTRPTGEVTFAATKATGELYTRSYTPATNTWTAFAQQGGSDWSPHAAPGLIAGTDGRIWLFAVKPTGKLFHTSYTPGQGWSGFFEDANGGWSPWAGPVGTARPGGSITWGAVKADGDIYTRSYDAATDSWTGFALHGPGGWSPFASPSITTSRTTNGPIWLFGVKVDGDIYHHAYEPGAGWGSFAHDSSAWSPRVAPVAAARAGGALTWTSTKDDGDLYTRSYTGTAWTDYVQHSTSWAN